jgi:hypothetical protein
MTVASGVAAVVGLVFGSLALTAPASAASGVWVSVNPSTITAGFQVSITGSCGDNTNQASVSSGAFTSPVALTPYGGSLSATAVVPSTTRAQGYTVTLKCASGNTATTTLWVISMATPTKGPNTGGGGMAGTGSATMLAGGLTVLVAGGSLGAVALRRRRGLGRM